VQIVETWIDGALLLICNVRRKRPRKGSCLSANADISFLAAVAAARPISLIGHFPIWCAADWLLTMEYRSTKRRCDFESRQCLRSEVSLQTLKYAGCQGIRALRLYV
jgi:hypothetical protein